MKKFIAFILCAHCCLAMKLKDISSNSDYFFKEDNDFYEDGYDVKNYENNDQTEEGDEYTNDDNSIFEVDKRHSNLKFCYEQYKLKESSPGVYPKYTLEIKCMRGKRNNFRKVTNCTSEVVDQYLLQKVKETFKPKKIKIFNGCKAFKRH